MSVIGIAIAGLGVLGLAGVTLAWLGVRGRRVDDHPVCRGCRFDLVGLYPAASSCPECGRGLGRRAVRAGNRRRRYGLVGVGATLIVLGVGGAVPIIWGAATSFDWNTIKPVWLLLREADGAKVGTANAALAELIARVGDGRLTGDAASGLVERALEVQGDESIAWQWGWGDLLAGAWQAGLMSDDQIVRFVTQSFVGEFAVRRRVHPGGPVPIRVAVRSRGPTRAMGVMGAAELGPMTIGGVSGEDTLSFQFMLPGRSASTGIGGAVVTVPEGIGPGTHDVELALRVEFSERARPDVVLGVLDRTYERCIEVVPPDVPLVALLTDDAELRASVDESVAAWVVEGNPMARGGSRRRVHVELNRNPVAIAGDVVLVAGGEEVVIGEVTSAARDDSRFETSFSASPDIDLTGAVVRIRPSREVASTTPDLDEIWGEEIEVPLTDEPGEGG
jgi:hypothetical protein